MITFEDIVKVAHEQKEKKNLGMAAFFYQKALQIKPNDIAIMYEFAKLREDQKRWRAAILLYRQILELEPKNINTYSALLYDEEMRCIWENRDADSERYRELLNTLDSYFTPSMLMDVPHTFEELYNWLKKRAKGDTPLQNVLKEKPFSHTDHRVGKKIKIGYFTTDLGASPCGNVFGGLLEKHNHDEFEVHCFSNADLEKRKDKEFKTRLLERHLKCFDVFHDVSGCKTFKEVAQNIYDAGIDILIDINMNGNNKWQALGYKPAPIIVGFFGIPSTTGLDYYDYMIGDKFTIPTDQRQFFTETIKDMPLCYHPADDKPEIAEGELHRMDVLLPDDAVVYAAMVTSFKLTTKYFDMWCRILKTVPNSVLWLISREDEEEDNLRKEAYKRGISPNRIVFLSCMDRPMFLACLKQADLFLDSEIWQAHSTCIEALSVGLPLLTRTGNCFCARVPSTMLKTFGLPELVCANDEEYEQKAIDYGLNPEKLKALKDKTIALMGPQNPLFDMATFAKNFEGLLKEMIAEKGLK